MPKDRWECLETGDQLIHEFKAIREQRKRAERAFVCTLLACFGLGFVAGSGLCGLVWFLFSFWVGV